MAGLPRVRRRKLIESVCADVTAGSTSPLEIRYVAKVVRPHGLPRGAGQAPARTPEEGTAYRDILYEEFGVIVELDGRLGHEAESEVFRDHTRDNAATLTGAATLRFGWLGVVGQPCRIAAQVATLLHIRGWTGQPARVRSRLHCPAQPRATCLLTPSASHPEPGHPKRPTRGVRGTGPHPAVTGPPTGQRTRARDRRWRVLAALEASRTQVGEREGQGRATERGLTGPRTRTFADCGGILARAPERLGTRLPIMWRMPRHVRPLPT